MNINPKLIAEIVIGITGVIGLGVFCKKTSLSKNTESTVTGNSTEEPDSFSDSFISENAAQAEADFVNTINTIRLKKLFAKLAEIDNREKKAQEEIAILKKEIKKILSSNRGWQTGMHRSMSFLVTMCERQYESVQL